MRFCSLSSGSSGNCIYVGTDNFHLLIDAGISGKRIEQGLNAAGLKTAEMSGILLTHEHADHIKGLGVLMRRYGLPVYATEGTIKWICKEQAIGDVDESLFHIIRADEEFAIGDIDAAACSISHDAAEPVAYVLRSGKKSAAAVTDLGTYGDYIVDKLRGVDVLLLEANHDADMLRRGRYPDYLKQRISGDKGHLSNEICGQLLCEVLHDDIKHIFLGHLSRENNYPPLAVKTVKSEITRGDIPYKGNDLPIAAAFRDRPSEAVEF